MPTSTRQQTLFCLAILFIAICTLQAEACGLRCRAAAIRTFPTEAEPFIGRRPAPVPASQFYDDKRPVPSCPDRLHNR
ncbi:hypothetical protein MA16_Dca004124 [Dendrobium catenatum]|uniref:Uncharacterized protein n=1 Tax=Dendrobium catenatum TaxID=906689 RepID=A0A2I0X2I2_9ASPA|nr:hypothetical protein MA16_Dca004124 [Dendrobium catenatum]